MVVEMVLGAEPMLQEVISPDTVPRKTCCFMLFESVGISSYDLPYIASQR